MKRRVRTHTYTEWRQRLTSKQQAEIIRLLRLDRNERDFDGHEPIASYQSLVVKLAALLDAGGEVVDLIEDIDPNEAWAEGA